ncbi:MAG: hypothetical protein ACLT1T_12585 [Oscillospiraceae bacterium]
MLIVTRIFTCAGQNHRKEQHGAYGLSSGTWPWILKLNYTLREVSRSASGLSGAPLTFRICDRMMQRTTQGVF